MKDRYFYIKPRRLEMELEPEELDEHREFDCIFYDHCLNHAYVFKFISFSCKDCEHFYKEN